MSGPKHTPTPARDAALRKAWAEHPEFGNEERSAFICGFEAGWNAAAPRLAEALNALLNELPSATTHPVMVEARAALREAGVES